MPRPTKLTRDRLQAAALSIVDQRGLAALSMRSLAAELGTGPMTLYNYVPSREALDALVVDAALAGASWPAPTADWAADVGAVARATWAAVRAHPNAVPLILTRRVRHETTLRPAEALLEALARGGRTGVGLLGGFRAVHGYIMGFAQIRLQAAAATDDPPAEARGAQLPADVFPRLVEAARSAAAIDLDQEFEAGLAVVLAGLKATAA